MTLLGPTPLFFITLNFTSFQFWTARLSHLEAVRAQLASIVVLNVLRSLDQAHSTYAHAFQHVHRDIGKAIVDTELCLMYLSALRPWCLKLHEAHYPDTITRLFPPLMMTLLLIWQHSGYVFQTLPLTWASHSRSCLTALNTSLGRFHMWYGATVMSHMVRCHCDVTGSIGSPVCPA